VEKVKIPGKDFNKIQKLQQALDLLDKKNQSYSVEEYLEINKLLYGGLSSDPAEKHIVNNLSARTAFMNETRKIVNEKLNAFINKYGDLSNIEPSATSRSGCIISLTILSLLIIIPIIRFFVKAIHQNKLEQIKVAEFMASHHLTYDSGKIEISVKPRKPNSLWTIRNAEPAEGMDVITNRLKYPRWAIEQIVEGRAIVTARIGSDGKVKTTTIDSTSGNFGLDWEASRIIESIKWKPEMWNNSPTETSVDIKVSFMIPGRPDSLK
jgi:TonB family protein